MSEPTCKQLQTPNILDIVLANNRNTISDIEVIPGTSDHDIVRFSINSHCRRKLNVKRKVYIGKKADSDHIRKELQVFTENFDKACEGKSLNDKCDKFELTMQRIIDNVYHTKQPVHGTISHGSCDP